MWCSIDASISKDFQEWNGFLFTVLKVHNSGAYYTFVSGGSATPPGGKNSGKSRRATPIRSWAIP